MPVWKDLTAKELPTQKKEGEAIGGITIDYLKKDNTDLKKKITDARNYIEELLESLRDAESVRQKHVHDFHKLEQEAKFDKIAADGIAKKAQLHEFENSNFKAERKTLIESQQRDRKRVKELELALNDVRSRHIKVVHENEILQREKNELISAAAIAEKKNIEAQKSLLEKLQLVTTLENINASQKRVIDSQGGEMNSMHVELTVMKEDMKALTQTISMQESTIAEKSLDSELLEHQVSKLKKSVMDVAHNASERSLAYGWNHTFGDSKSIHKIGNNNGRGRHEINDKRLSTTGYGPRIGTTGATTSMSSTDISMMGGTSPLAIGNGIGMTNDIRPRSSGSMNLDTSSSMNDLSAIKRVDKIQTLPSLTHSPTGKYKLDNTHMVGHSTSKRPTTTQGMLESVVSPMASPFSSHRKSNSIMVDRISTTHNVSRYIDGLTPTGRKVDPSEVQALRKEASQKQKYVFFNDTGGIDTPTATSIPPTNVPTTTTVVHNNYDTTSLNGDNNNNNNNESDIATTTIIEGAEATESNISTENDAHISSGNGSADVQDTQDDSSLNEHDMADAEAEKKLQAAEEAARKEREYKMKVARENSAKLKQEKLKQRSSSKKLSGRMKTSFLGSGLGLRVNHNDGFNPSGSAKSVLRKIMNEFNSH